MQQKGGRATLIVGEQKNKPSRGMLMKTDITFLVQKAKQGDAHAFSSLYELYKDDMYRFALYMMKKPTDAEDAVQEALLSAWQSLKSLRECELFKSWLFKILSNKCKTALIKNGKNPEAVDVEGAEYLCASDDTGIGFLGCELSQALSSLTPPDGQIVLLSVIGGFKSYELSVIFDMPPSTVRSRQKRALEKLRKFLS